MPGQEIRDTLGRWRHALTDNDEKQHGFSKIIRLVIVCVGTLLLLLVIIAGVRSVRDASDQWPESKILRDIDNSTLGFQKIFVINLPKRTDRRDSMSLAAAFSGIEVEYIDGVTEVADEALPPGGKEKNFQDSVVGAWRAHMNAVRKVVEQNLTSALILEDDSDWDIRIKSQMKDFARSTRLLMQPMRGTTNKFLDPTHDGDHLLGASDIDVRKEITSEPTTSPYGDVDKWDVLWIGHCGSHFPHRSDTGMALGRAVLYDDETVPEPQHINPHLGNKDLTKEYPPHTRVTHRAKATMCTLAYAVSRPGARAILYELGVSDLHRSYDNSLREICNGKANRRERICYSVQPQLFNHHRPAGNRSAFSDISGFGGGYNEQPFSWNIRWSTRVNFPKLLDGHTDYIDLFKDGEEPDDSIG